MALDLGAVIARVFMDTAQFDAQYTRTERRFALLGGSASKSAGGVRKLDMSLAGAGTAASTAAVGMDRTARSTLAAGAAADKAAAAAKRQTVASDRTALAAQRNARALAEMATLQGRVAGMSAKQAQAAYRLAAAQARVNELQASGVATTRQLASAQAALIAAQRNSQRAAVFTAANMMTVGKKMSHAITLPVVAFAAYGAKQAIDLEKQMSLLRTAAGESESNMVQITGGIKKVSSDTATSLDHLGEGMYVVAKAAKSRGWTGAEQLVILKAAAQGAAAESVGLTVATDALSTVMTDYHSKASDAVSVENQLVKASGLAKTNFGLFSESLSNVTPIAAALGISFAEVGGSLATMTQHGVSAQQATQNMRNLMFNLAGQNNVASQAMQQLGIDTVDLAKNLGKRGLTGTLAIVDNALKTHTKNGMVTVDIHKAAALATKSLNAMTGDFTGKLKQQSEGLVSGKVNIKEYTAYAKSLGGQAGAGALQFRSLFLNSQGFSNQLKSGKGTITTSVAQYQKLLGGMTGASVAMQISGKYAADNAKNVAAVGEAAGHAGKDVHGFDQTQKTLAYKLRDAGNKAALLATTVGEKLIPFLGRLATGATHAFQAFDGLDSGTKKTIAWSIGILAALGPVLAIGGRLGKAGAALATFAGASEAAATRVGLAMQRMGGAVAGIGLVYAGTKTNGAGGAIMGALGGGLTGAAIGSFFGPIGTAVGGVSGAVIGLGAHFLATGDDADDAGHKAALAGQRAAAAAERARERIEAQKQAVQGLTQAILSDNDAIGANTRAQVVNDLQKTKAGSKGPSALGLAQQAGLDPTLVVSSVMGDRKAQGQLQGQINQVGANLARKGLTRETSAQSQALGKLLVLMQQEGVLLARGGREADLQKMALSKLNLATRSVATQVKFYGSTLDQSTVAGRMNNKFLEDHVAALNKDHKAGKLTQQQWLRQLGTLDNQAVKLGMAKDEVAKYIGAYSRIPKSVATRLLADPKVAKSAVGDVLRSLLNLPKKKTTTLSANPALANRSIVQLNARIAAIRQSRSPVINANTALGRAAIAALSARITALGGKVVAPTVKLNDQLSSPFAAMIASLSGRTITVHTKLVGAAGAGGNLGGVVGATPGKKGPGKARGGSAPEGYFAVGEEGPEIAHKRGNRVEIMSNPQSRMFIQRTGLMFPGFAKGTGGITHSGKDWIYDGIKYASERAAENARTRAGKKKGKASAEAVTSAIGGIGQTYSSPIDLSTTGIGRLNAQISRAVAVLQQQIAKGLSKKTAASARAQIANLQRDANRQLGALRLKIRTSDITALRGALKGTAAEARDAFAQLITDARNAGASSSVLAVFGSGRRRLLTNQANLARGQARLDSMKEYGGGITDTLRGNFDPSKYGSAADFVAGANDAAGVNNTYAKELDGIRSRVKGNKTLTDLANTLAAQGNSAGLDTLANASKAELANISKAYGGYTASLSAGGNAATTLKFGQSQASQQGVVNTLTAQQGQLVGAMSDLAALLPALAKRPQRLVVNGHEITSQVVTDKQFDDAIAAVLRRLTAVKKHGRKP